MINLTDFQYIKTLSDIVVNQALNKAYYLVKYCHLDQDIYVKELWETDLITHESRKLPFENPNKLRKHVIGLCVLCRENKLWQYDVVKETFTEIMSLNFQVSDFSSEKRYLALMTKKESETDSSNKTFDHMGLRCIQYFGEIKHGHLNTIVEEHTSNFYYNAVLDSAVFVTFESGLKPTYQTIYLYDFDKKQLSKVSEKRFRVENILLTDESEIVMTASDMTIESRNDDKSIYRLKSDGDIISCQSPVGSFESMGVYTDCHEFDTRRGQYADGKATFISVREHGESLLSVDNLLKIQVGQTIDSYAHYKDGFVVAGLSKDALHELYLVKDDVKRMTNHNQRISQRMLKPEAVDGPVPCWVIKPTHVFDHHPAVLMIHGGPKGMYAPVYSHDMQVLANSGYYVIFMNPPGSDGYGNDYSNIRSNFGQLPFEALMNMLDVVLKKYPSIDDKRLGVMGGSYGGYLTNYAITHTHRFRAAISARGISSLINTFISSDIGFEYIYEYMGNELTPWDGMNEYVEASPLYKAHLVKTPTLYLHGGQDVRCHPMESLNMYHSLKYHGVETEIRIFEKEGHGFTISGLPSHRLERYQLILKWFDHYLKEEQ